MKVSGSNTVQIDASAERCAAALLDFASYPDWFPGVREARPCPDVDGAPAGWLRFSAGIGALGDVECVLRYEVEAGRRLTPSVVTGDLRVHGRGWLLSALGPESTEVTYDVTVEMDVPGGFVTERALKGPARRFLVEQPPERLRDYLAGAAA